MMDMKKDLAYQAMGYEVVRVPYFVQLSTDVIATLFRDDIEWGQTYPHGLISDKALTPQDFNAQGYEKYIEFVERMPSDIKRSILDSEVDRLLQLHNKTFNANLDRDDVEQIAAYIPWYGNES